jgi:alkylation response protein AidB-like acyl-CoA dehydrogenase
VRLAEAVALIRAARAWLREALQQLSTAVLSGEQDQVDKRANMLLAATNATHSAAKAVDIIYTVSGASANYRRNPLQRALRDVHAVTQHFATAAPQYESAGRILLGLPPLPPSFILS